MKNIDNVKRRGRERKAVRVEVGERAFQALLEEFDAKRAEREPVLQPTR